MSIGQKEKFQLTINMFLPAFLGQKYWFVRYLFGLISQVMSTKRPPFLKCCLATKWTKDDNNKFAWENVIRSVNQISRVHLLMEV